jgi:hypothetical protein
MSLILANGRISPPTPIGTPTSSCSLKACYKFIPTVAATNSTNLCKLVLELASPCWTKQLPTPNVLAIPKLSLTIYYTTFISLSLKAIANHFLLTCLLAMRMI